MEWALDIAIAMIQILYSILFVVYDFIHRKKPPSIPPINDPLLKLSATTLAAKIREREISSQAVVEAYIKRIKEVNPYLNAVVEDRFVAALNEAKNCDEKLNSKEMNIATLKKEKPLYGVPFTVKESCGLKGLSQTGCTLPRKGMKAPADSFIVESLRNAGGIPLCVTNTSEMCSNFDSSNYLYGSTSNPYDTRYTVGGSSGGEGAILGAGASLIGIGSDLAGSIRIPAHFNGVFGHKPTAGIIPIKGHYPIVETDEFRKFLVVGPMTRYAEDLHLTMKIMTSECGHNLQLDEPVHIKNLKVYYMDFMEPFLNVRSPTADIKARIKWATNYLAERGATVEQLPKDCLPELFQTVVAIFARNVETPEVLLDADDPKHHKNPMHEFVKGIFGLSQYTKSLCFSKILVDLNGLVMASSMPHYEAVFENYRKKLTELLQDNCVFIFPSYPRPAFHKPLVNFRLDYSLYSVLMNLLQLPATHVPMGLSNGLPIGFQVIAGLYQDRLCLAVAKELEAKFGGWIPPSEGTTS